MPHDSDQRCPFSPETRPLDAPDPSRELLRSAGPLARAEAPAGGPVWIVTDAELARQVLSDARFAKDPALAPSGWDRRSAGLEPTAAEQMSLTTLDGPPHSTLRQAFAPLLSAQRMQAAYPRMLDLARQLLAGVAGGAGGDADGGVGGGGVDLMADFTTRYPLTILCDLLGIPPEQVDTAVDACRLMPVDYPSHVGQAMAGFAALAAAALRTDGGLARDLATRMPPGSTERDLEYQVFTLLFAGQLTTDLAIGFLVARLLGGDAPGDDDALVRETLRRHPPAPFTLWRFTATDVELAGVHLAAGTPVLVDIQGINDHLDPGANDLSFGAGPHYCIGARLAQLELRALAEVIRSDHPDARLLVPYSELRHTSPGGIMGSRLHTLPVSLSS